MPSPHQFKVGQQLYFVPTNGFYGTTGQITVTAIGRRWITISTGNPRYRFDKNKSEHAYENEWFCDGEGFQSPGSVFLSEHDHLKKQKHLAIYAALKKSFAGMHRDDYQRFDIDRLSFAARVLGVNVDGELPPTKEFICEKCGLRTDATSNTAPTF